MQNEIARAKRIQRELDQLKHEWATRPELPAKQPSPPTAPSASASMIRG